jgi:hypothetical protein
LVIVKEKRKKIVGMHFKRKELLKREKNNNE